MFQLREFGGRYHAAEIEAQLLGAGFHPDGVRPSSHGLILPYLGLSGEEHNMNTREGIQTAVNLEKLLIAPQSAALVGIDFEDGEKLGQLKEIMHFFREV